MLFSLWCLLFFDKKIKIKIKKLKKSVEKTKNKYREDNEF